MDLAKLFQCIIENRIPVLKDGETCSLKEAFHVMKEDGNYMTDFVVNDDGDIEQVRCDRIYL